MKINIKESTIVKPGEETPSENLWLSNIDLLYGITYHVPLVFLYKPNASSNFFDANLLKDTLSKVLVSFYPIAGRFGRDEKGRLEINCNGEGVVFIEAEADFEMSNFSSSTTSNVEIQQLIPAVDYSSHFSSIPLLVLQVTKFRCGHVTLGVGWNHIVVDGCGILNFINSWANTTRGVTINIPPFINRTILRSRDPPNPTFHHLEFEPSPSMNIIGQGSGYQSSSQPNLATVINISQEEVHNLKALANNKYTTYETLAAHIWRCTCKARGLSDDQETKLFISLDARSRLDPPLLLGYFGNAIFLATTIALSGDIVSEPFMETIERVHKAIERMDNEYIRSSIDYLEINGDSPKGIGCPNLTVLSWLRLPYNEADYGWGRPSHIKGATPIEGIGVLLSNPIEKGTNLSLTICLRDDHMQSFQKLFNEF